METCVVIADYCDNIKEMVQIGSGQEIKIVKKNSLIAYLIVTKSDENIQYN